MRIFPQYNITCKESHPGRDPSYLCSCVRWEQFPRVNCFRLFHRSITIISDGGVYQLQAHICQIRQKSPPPGHRVPPLRRHCKPWVIKEAVGLGVYELHPLPAIPLQGGHPGRRNISGRDHQYLCLCNIGAQIGSRLQYIRKQGWIQVRIERLDDK